MTVACSDSEGSWRNQIWRFLHKLTRISLLITCSALLYSLLAGMDRGASRRLKEPIEILGVAARWVRSQLTNTSECKRLLISDQCSLVVSDVVNPFEDNRRTLPFMSFPKITMSSVLVRLRVGAAFERKYS